MKIFGHEKQKTLLKKIFETKKIPHALLFNGDESIGKKLVALEFVKSFYCENGVYGGCGKCQSCSLFDDKSIPDFYFIDCKDKEQIKASNIRDLLYNINLRNFSNKYKFIIFDNAQFLKDQSANILLKTLEEPKNDTYFILITSNYSTLPPTIVSRCALWLFDNLTIQDIKDVLKNNNINLNNDFDYSLFEGNLSNINLKDENLFSNKKEEEIKNLIINILNGNEADIFVISSKLFDNKDLTKESFTLLRCIFRDMMLDEQNKKLKSLFSLSLNNILFAENLVFNRYISSKTLLENILLNLLGANITKNNKNTLYDITKIYEK